MADFDTQINVGMNVDGVISGTEKAKRSVRDLGESAREAGRGTGAIGDGMAGSAQKVEQATKSMVGSLQRQIAATEAGDKSTRAYQESLARMRGVDVGVLKPYLDQLDAAKKKAEAAAQSADSLAKSLSAIKVGAALVASAGAAFVAYAKNINDGVDALNDLKDATGASIENISALENVALRSGTSFDTVGASLLKLNQALGASKPGGDTEKAIQAIGLSVADLKALDPAEAFRKIAVSLSGYSDDANKARLTQELFGKSLKDIAPLLKDVSDAGKLVGTVTTEQAEAAEALNKELFALQKNATDLGRSLISDLVPAINQAIAAFRDGNAAGKGFFEIAWDRYWSNVADVYAKPEKTMQQYSARLVEIDKTLSSGQIHYVERNRLLKEQFEIQQKIAKANQFSADNESSAESARLKRRPSVKDIGAIGGPTASQISAASSAAKAARDQAIKDDIAGFKLMEDARKEYDKRMADGLKAEIAAYNESAKAQEVAQQKTIDAYQKAADSSAQRAAGLADEEAAVALSIASNVSLAVAVEELGLSRTREAQAKALSSGADGATLLALQQEIESREKIVKLISSKEGRAAAADSAKAAQAEWKKAAEKINDSITDALLRGFESGKGFAENLRDTVVNMFKTMVLRPTVSAIVTGLSGLGATGAASAATGLSGAGGLIGGVGQMAAIGTAFGEGFVSTLAGNSLTIAAQAAGGGTLAGIGGAIGAVAPYALAAAAVYTLLTREKNYVKSTGDAAVNFGATGSVTGASDFKGQTYEANVSTAANKFVTDLNAEYLKAAKSLDLGAVASSFAFGSNDAGKFRIGGSAGGVGFDSGELDQSPEAIKLAASRAVFAAIQGSELPGYLSKAFNGITAGSASQEQITSALGFAQSLKAVRFGLLDATAQQAEYQKIIDAGTASLGTSADTFKTDFIAAIDSGLTPEGLAEWSALGGTMQALEQITGKTSGSLATLGRSIADIANERKSLQDQLDELTLTSTQLLDKQRNAIDLSNRELFDQVQAQISLKDATEKSTAALAAAASIRSSAQSVVLNNDILNGSSPQAVALKGAQFNLDNAVQAVRDLGTKVGNPNAQSFTGADIEAAANNFSQYLGQSFTEDFAKAIEAYYTAKVGVKNAAETLAGVQTATPTTPAAVDNSAAEAALRILQERTGLQQQYDNLTLSSVQLLAKQRAALDESNRALFDNINLETARQAVEAQTGTLADRLAIANGTSTEREIALRKELEGALNASNAATITAIYAAEDLAEANRKKAIADKEAAAAALTLAGDNANAALAGVQRAIDAQKKLAQVQVDVAQESVSNIASIFNALKSNIATLYGSVDSTAQQSAAQGNSFIAQALATANATGYLPDAGELADAVAAAMRGTEQAVYASQADADFAALELAGRLSSLKDLSKSGLSTAEQALKAAKDQITILDETLDNARAQLDAMNGINTSVLSVADALKLFNDSLQALLIAKNVSAAPPGGYGPRDTGNKDVVLTGSGVRDTATSVATPQPSSYAAVTGLTALYGTSYVNSLGGTIDDLYAAAKAAKLPGFAVGTNYVPKDMIARIHEGEAIVPKAYNPAAGASSGNARLESLVEGLTAEVQRLQSIVNDGNKHQRRTADAVNGNAEMPMVVETV